MTDLSDLLRSSLAGGSLLALPLALLGGVVTALNPCCLAVYPAATASCCAARGEGAPRAISTAAAFVAGLALATTFLGVAAALAGRTITSLGGWARYAIALVPLLMALHLLGWIRVPLPTRFRGSSVPGVGGAFLSGLLLSLVLVPCGTPLLASVMSYAAYQGSIAFGALLLFVYGAGAGIPVLLLASVAGTVATRLDASGWSTRLDRIVAVVLLALGFYLLWRA